MRFAVAMATYARPGGSTPDKLRRSLRALAAQVGPVTWHAYIVGDCYEPRRELVDIVGECLPAGSFTLTNLPEPGERGKVDPKLLWYTAGATAVNTALDLAAAAGETWVAHLDDDDQWAADHLEHLGAGVRAHPDAAVVHTQAEHVGRPLFPVLNRLVITRGGPRLACNVCHSSVAFNLQVTGSARYPVGTSWPADALMWDTLQRAHGLESFVHVPAVTVWHLTEHNTPEGPKRHRLIYSNAALGLPPAAIANASVAYVRFDRPLQEAGDDDPERVREYLAAWWPKLLPGGGVLYRGSGGAPSSNLAAAGTPLPYEFVREGYVAAFPPVAAAPPAP
jgi:hypothetical protein